jgi:hypothetical protein
MKRDLKTKLHEMTHDDLMRWISWIVAFAVGILTSMFGIYFLYFAKDGVSTDPEQWGQFGDFVGGTANPILGFLTLIALILTITIQSRELELSRKELELTRDQLRRSALAQELSEKALRAQADAADRSARLSGINFLLDHYKGALKEMHGQAYVSDDPRLARLKSLQEREQVLLGMLDAVFKEMTKAKENDDGRN